MNITLLSDTHGLHSELDLPGGDMLIHAGNITEYGTEEEVSDFIKWFVRQPHNHKIFIAGNHDFFLEQATGRQKKKLIPSDIIYLQNQAVEINGFKIYGSPVTPYYMGMAFNRRTGKDIQKEWRKIPGDTDILITHGPPLGIMDDNIGCADLLKSVQAINPGIHVFGHIHEQFGSVQQGGTRFFNAALVNNPDPFGRMEYKILHQPAYLRLLLA